MTTTPAPAPAPAPITPGKVQPGMGKGRSIAPVAIRTLVAEMVCDLPSAT